MDKKQERKMDKKTKGRKRQRNQTDESGWRDVSVPEACQSTRRKSIDLGSKNLGYCDVAFGGPRRLYFYRWEVVHLCDDGKELTVRATDALLTELKKDQDYVHLRKVLIEDQPPVNVKTHGMSYAAYGFYHAQKHQNKDLTFGIEFINSTRKLDLCHKLGADVSHDYASDHSHNKALAIAAVIRILTFYKLMDVLEWFLAQPKKDDLADAFLQALDDYDRENPSFLHADLIRKSKQECKAAKKKRRQHQATKRPPTVGLLNLDRPV